MALATLLAVCLLAQRCVWSRTSAPAGSVGSGHRTAQKTKTLRSHHRRNSELRGPASGGQGGGHAEAAGRQPPRLSTAVAQAHRTRAHREDAIASESERRRSPTLFGKTEQEPQARRRVGSHRDLERQRRAVDAMIGVAQTRFDDRKDAAAGGGRGGVSVWERSLDGPGPALCKPWDS